MADLDNMMTAVRSAAEKSGLVCDLDRIQIQFILERDDGKRDAIMGNPQCSLQASLASLVAVAEGNEDAYANELVASALGHFK